MEMSTLSLSPPSARVRHAVYLLVHSVQTQACVKSMLVYPNQILVCYWRKSYSFLTQQRVTHSSEYNPYFLVVLYILQYE